MATKDTFTVNVAGGTGHSITWQRPDSIGDPEWTKRIAGEHDETITLKVSKAVAAALNDLAVQQIVIKMQSAGRPELKNGRAAVQAKVDAYKFGARATSAATVLDGEALTKAGFTKEQLEILRKQGAVIA